VQPGEERHDVQAELMRLHLARAEHVEA